MRTIRRHKIAQQMILSNVAGVCVSAITLVLGFYLGHALQKPRLSIVDLERNFYNESHELSDDLEEQLKQQPVLVQVLRNDLERSVVGKERDPCTDWLDGEHWRDVCVDSVLSAARGLSASLTAEPDMPMPELLKSMRPSPAQREAFAKTLKQLTQEMENIRSDQNKVRTGDMDFDVGVLNTGDFDGVVSKFGKLTFPGGWFTLSSDKFTVIKAHGFETIEFGWRGWTTNEGEALEKWKEIVRKRGESQFRIELESGEGKSITYDTKL